MNKLVTSLGLCLGAYAGHQTWRGLAAERDWDTRRARFGRTGSALITGASSGIGAAFARRLAAEGYNLVLTARRASRLESLAQELESRNGIKAEALPADLAAPVQVERVAARARESDDLTLLVNNAGFGASGHFRKVSLETHLRMIQVHQQATLALTHAALPELVSRGYGAVINVSSAAAFVGVPGSATYAATKSFLNHWSQALASELHGTGVRVQALCPGFTHTEFHDHPELVGFRKSSIPEMFWMPPEPVVEASLRALRRDQVIVTPGFWYQLLELVTRPRLHEPLIQDWGVRVRRARQL